MIFSFREKPIVIDMITTNNTLHYASGLFPANEYHPEWWRKLPAMLEEHENNVYPSATAKKCPGIIDLYKNSFILPMWSELNVKVYNETGRYEYQFADEISKLTPHNPQQFNRAFDLFTTQHFKLCSPWKIRTSEPLQILWADPIYNNSDNLFNYRILPGIIAHDKHLLDVNVNLMVQRNPDKDVLYNIKFNQPLYQLIPITSRKVIVKHHLLTDSELSKELKFNRLTFVGFYKTLGKIINAKKEGVCPFGKDR